MTFGRVKALAFITEPNAELWPSVV